jgi:hypothetical protein
MSCSCAGARLATDGPSAWREVVPGGEAWEGNRFLHTGWLYCTPYLYTVQHGGTGTEYNEMQAARAGEKKGA